MSYRDRWWCDTHRDCIKSVKCDRVLTETDIEKIEENDLTVEFLDDPPCYVKRELLSIG